MGRHGHVLEESGEALAAVIYLVAVRSASRRARAARRMGTATSADAESLAVAADGRGRTAATRGARS